MDFSLDAISAKLGLLGVTTACIVAVVLLLVSSVILWALGLIVAVAFAVIGLGLVYALNSMNLLDVEKDRWVLLLPVIMFFLGFGADHVGILSISPLSVSDPVSTSITWFLLVMIVLVLIVDVVVDLREG
ncbi:MAG: hypothetical protein NWF06_10360 [Candidatus Bathyarchaeota archaeon]|nr:hypothetical protein [Candidatus Bathyarchaeum sp.]